MSWLIHKTLSVLVLGISLVVMSGWLFNQDLLKSFGSDLTIMVMNTAVCFSLCAIALLFAPAYRAYQRPVQMTVGLVIILISAITIFQDIAGVSFGIDQLLAHVRIEDDNPHPGRMSPLTALCFILSGALLLLLPQQRGPVANYVVQLLVLVILVFAMSGVAAASVRLDLLYDWYRYARMASPTAIGFVLIVTCLWLSWYRDEAREGGFLGRDDTRIAATGVIIIALVAFLAGMSGFAILAHQMESILESALLETYSNHANLVEESINSALISTEPITTRLLLNRSLIQLNKTPEDGLAREIIREDAMSFLGINYTAVAIYAKDNALVAGAGTFTSDAPLQAELRLPSADQHADLLWKDGAILQVRRDIIVNGEKIGTARLERKLPGVGNLLFAKDLLGETAETRICAPDGTDNMDCLPSWRRSDILSRTPRIREGNVSSMDFALRGQKGLRLTRDYLKRQTITAYGPIGSLGLGMIVKVDAAEFYGPLRDKLHYIILALIALSGLGIFLQRVQLVPLVRKLASSEETFRLAMENASIGMAILDPTGHFIKVNTALCTLFGYPRNELLETNFQGLTHPDDLGANLEATQKLKDGEISNYRIEKRYIHKNGSVIWALLNCSLVPHHNGSPSFFIAHIQDVTLQKEIERMKSEFISTVSHELRTPLTSIRGSLGLIEGVMTKDLPQTTANLISIAHKNTERLILLINDILDIDKIAAGQMRFDMKSERITPLILQAIEANEAYAKKLNVTLNLGQVAANSQINVDAGRLIQALSNLLSNAAKFSKRDSEVFVYVTTENEHVRINVEDNGPGIPDEFRARIFSKFSQADSSAKRAYSGTGLGLHITKQIVEHMHGTVGFDTRSGKGTVFWLEFPAADQSPKDAPAIITKKRVLICEDDRDVATILQAQIAKAGLSSDVTYSLEDAREKLKRNAYEAMTLDLLFPRGTGLDFIQELRTEKATIDLPVVVVSAKADEARKKLDGVAIGVVDWIAKPIDEKRLVAALKRTTHVSEGNRMQNVLHIEDDKDLSRMLALALDSKAKLINVGSLKEAKQYLAQEFFTLIILDIGLTDGNGLALLGALNDYTPKPIPVLILSADEVTQEVRKSVAGVMIKSRMSETKIVETILSLLDGNNGSPNGPRT